MKVCITGYTYIRKNLFDVWEYYKEKDQLFFVLPKKWKAKGGEHIYYPAKDTKLRILKTVALFWHSKYPVIKGMLKGWMPWLIFKLIYLRLKGVRVLFTASEPNLLTTIHNAILARLFGLKHVFNFWDNVPSGRRYGPLKKFVYNSLIKVSIFLSHGAVCGNKKATEILKSYGGKINIETFPTSGFDISKFSPEVKATYREEYNLNNKMIFLFAGLFDKNKGINYLIDAFKKVSQEISNCHLILVGTGPEEGNLRTQVKDSDLNNKVTFIKWVKHNRMPELLKSCDVFMYPSIYCFGWEEQFGYAMAEASLIEKPVITTDTGSMKEVVLDLKTGLIVPEKDVLRLTESMLKLAKSEDLREKYGKTGRQYIIDNYGHKVIAEKFYNLFKEL